MIARVQESQNFGMSWREQNFEEFIVHVKHFTWRWGLGSPPAMINGSAEVDLCGKLCGPGSWKSKQTNKPTDTHRTEQTHTQNGTDTHTRNGTHTQTQSGTHTETEQKHTHTETEHTHRNGTHTQSGSHTHTHTQKRNTHTETEHTHRNGTHTQNETHTHTRNGTHTHKRNIHTVKEHTHTRNGTHPHTERNTHTHRTEHSSVRDRYDDASVALAQFAPHCDQTKLTAKHADHPLQMLHSSTSTWTSPSGHGSGPAVGVQRASRTENLHAH